MLTIKTKTALVVGATSLVGKELVKLLLASNRYEKVIVWVRRTLGIDHNKLQEEEINFEKLESYEIHQDVTHVYCCLGTTINKAGSKEAFQRVDLTYPLQLARKAKIAGVLQFIVISAMGASKDSKVFYSRTKGEMEEALQNIALPGLHIVRPSLLLGKREEFRIGEGLAAMFTAIVPFLFTGSLKKYKPIPAAMVAYAMYRVANQEITGNHIYESDRLFALNKE